MKTKLFVPVLMAIVLSFPIEVAGQSMDSLRENLLKIISGKSCFCMADHYTDSDRGQKAEGKFARRE